MSSILPQISSLQETPSFNFRYAEILLHLFVTKLLSMDEIEIGTFIEADEEGSVIAFDGDDFENTQLQLRFAENRFVLVLQEHSDEHFACTFNYKIFDHSVLYQRIPDKLRAAMEDVASDNESATFRSDNL